MESQKVRIFDTTLRDGEQTPGVSITPEQKLNIAIKLSELGVDTIEAGFPVVSDGEKEGIKKVVKQNWYRSRYWQELSNQTLIQRLTAA